MNTNWPGLFPFDPLSGHDFQRSQAPATKIGLAIGWLNQAAVPQLPPLSWRQESLAEFAGYCHQLALACRRYGVGLFPALARAVSEPLGRDLVLALAATPPEVAAFRQLVWPQVQAYLAAEKLRWRWLRQGGLALFQRRFRLPWEGELDAAERQHAERWQETLLAWLRLPIEKQGAVLDFPPLADRSVLTGTFRAMDALYRERGMMGVEAAVDRLLQTTGDPDLLYVLAQAAHTYRPRPVIRSILRQREQAVLSELGRRLQALVQFFGVLGAAEESPDTLRDLFLSAWPVGQEATAAVHQAAAVLAPCFRLPLPAYPVLSEEPPPPCAVPAGEPPEELLLRRFAGVLALPHMPPAALDLAPLLAHWPAALLARLVARLPLPTLLVAIRALPSPIATAQLGQVLRLMGLCPAHHSALETVLQAVVDAQSERGWALRRAMEWEAEDRVFFPAGSVSPTSSAAELAVLAEQRWQQLPLPARYRLPAPQPDQDSYPPVTTPAQYPGQEPLADPAALPTGLGGCIDAMCEWLLLERLDTSLAGKLWQSLSVNVQQAWLAAAESLPDAPEDLPLPDTLRNLEHAEGGGDTVLSQLEVDALLLPAPETPTLYEAPKVYSPEVRERLVRAFLVSWGRRAAIRQ